MATNTAPKIKPQHPPLARDPHGNLIAIPDGTSAWRICRETSGRPREIRGPDDQVVRFPLDLTADALVDMCGSGVFRVYALDEVGAPLGDEHIAKWDLTPGARELRNVAHQDSVIQPASRSSGGSGSLSEFRSVIETMTQAMTQMMRTNSDALRIVTDSHVDLAKTIANAKGLPRNGAFAPALPPARVEEDDDDDQDESDEQESRPRGVIDLLMPFAEKAAEVMPGLVMGKVMQQPQTQDRAALPASGAGSSSDEDLANRGFEPRDLVDLQYAKRKGDAKRAAKLRSQSTGTPGSVAALQARIISDPALVQHLIEIKQLLSADEIEKLMAMVGQTSEQQQVQFIDMIKQLPVDHAAEFCRDIIGDASGSNTPKEG